MGKGPVSIVVVLLSALALSACEKKAEAPPAPAPAAEQAAPAAEPAAPAVEQTAPATDPAATPEATNQEDEAQGGGPRV